MSLLDENGLARVWSKMKTWVGNQLPGDFSGATTASAGIHGLVPAPTTTDTEKFLRGDGSWGDGGKPMVVLSYGKSTWDDFIEAYNNHVIVYCKASSNSNPATGNQTRQAFMAYVNSEPPTEVEFQYYRSVSSHSDSQQGDQVFIYKLNKNSGWSVTTRNSFTKIVAGSNMTSKYSNGALTLNATGGGTDEKVTQTETEENADYEVLVSGTASTATTTEGVNKASSFIYNADKKAITIGGRAAGSTVGSYSFAQGEGVVASNQHCNAFGWESTAAGPFSHVEGYCTYTSGYCAHAEGSFTKATYSNAHAEGTSTTASEHCAHAEGTNTYAAGIDSHAEGGYTYAGASFAHAEGEYTTVTGNGSHGEGYKNNVTGAFSHAEGISNSLAAYCGHVEGGDNILTDYGSYGHVEGQSSSATAYTAHAEGCRTYAGGSSSHAEGVGSSVSNIAQGGHAEGTYTYANSYGAHAEGAYTYANSYGAHAEGYYTYGSGYCSHVQGIGTSSTHKAQHVFGSYNMIDASTAASGQRGNYIEIVGNGDQVYNKETKEYDTTYSNARTLDWSGNEVLSGKLTVGTAPTADMDVATKKYVDDTVTAAIAQVLAAQY